MDVRELRIGNYIYDDFKEVHMVERIESQKYNGWNGGDPSLVIFSKLKDGDDHMYSCDVISPIPLTEEWLLKLGGEIKPFSMGITLDRFRFIWKDEYKYWYVLDKNSQAYMTKIEWVHECQNFFRYVNGQELEVKL